MTIGDAALAAFPVSVAINAFFTNRLIRKVDKLNDWIAGTAERPGIAGKVELLNAAVFDADGNVAPLHFHRRKADQ